ncbi:MAG: hypothetical protein JRN15_06545 [Nitrososphaerota archaeon]|nr:hypothetical protein [Nitrososphaerota archaeon]
MPKPEKLLLGYIQIRGHALRRIFEKIRDNPKVTYAELSNQFLVMGSNQEGRKESKASLRDYVNFLNALDMIVASGDGDDGSFRVSGKNTDLEFGLSLLGSIRKATDQSFYSLQQLLAQSDVLQWDDATLQKEAERSLNFDFAWTHEKIAFFVNMADYLGIGKKLTSGLLNSPSENLVLGMLKQVSGDGHGFIPAKEAINKIRAQFLEPYTAKGDLYQGFQWALEGLSQKGLVKFKLESDATRRSEPIRVVGADVSLLGISART